MSTLRLLLERSPRGARLRGRCASVALALVFVAGLLVALGLGFVALIALAGLVSLAALLVLHLRGADSAFRERLGSLARATERWVALRARAMAARFPPALAAAGARSGRPTRSDSEPGRALAEHGVAVGTGEDPTVEMAAKETWRDDLAARGWDPLPRLKRVSDALPRPHALTPRGWISTVLHPVSASPTMSLTLVETGSRCHALGRALRQAGRPEQAATMHGAACLIFGRVGNSRAEALAANAVGVALAEAGKQDAALEHFEHSRALLRKLGDEEWEGKVLANISQAKHRAGEDEEAIGLLRSALEKLSPETDAYRRVERRLNQAS